MMAYEGQYYGANGFLDLEDDPLSCCFVFCAEES